jgi:hypothetical protein
MQDRDLLCAELLLDPRSDESSLRIVAAIEAQDRRVAILRRIVRQFGALEAGLIMRMLFSP